MSTRSRTAVLAALAHKCEILPVVFDKKRLKERKARLSRIAEGSVAVSAAGDAIAAMQAAVAVTVVTSAAVTS